MGDWIKSNQFTANIIITLILMGIFAFAIAKPYVDNRVENTNLRISETNHKIESLTDSVYVSMKESVCIQKETAQTLTAISTDLNKILNGRKK